MEKVLSTSLENVGNDKDFEEIKEMAEVYARKATGLVREASLVDTTLFGVMNNAVAVSLWFFLDWGPLDYPGLNVLLTCVIGLILCTGFAVMWGILGGSMPRSGGSYVYNSRIIHPSIATAVSVCNAGFVMVMWIWVLTPWIPQVGVPILAGCLEIAPEAIEFWTTPAGMYIMSTIINVLALAVVALGLRTYFRIQTLMVAWGIIGVIIAGIIFTTTSPTAFETIWNNHAAETGSLDLAATIAAADVGMEGIPTTWNWTSTLGALLPLSWASVYGYFITCIGGEVKNPRRSIMIGQVANMAVSVLLLMWVSLAFQAMGGYQFLHAQAYMDVLIEEEGFEAANAIGYNFPFRLTYINTASLIVGFNRILGFIMGMSFILMDFLWIPASYIFFSRGLLAWGMDRIGPRWFTDVNLRLGSPVKVLLLCFVLSQAAMTHYVLYPDILGALTVELMQLLSVFGVTAIACTIFPFVKKVRHIWDVSPYKGWRVIGIPAATIAGIVSLILVGILVWASWYPELLSDLLASWSWIYVIVWIFGLAWYFGWKSYRARQGIDVTLAFKELAPE